MGQQRYALGLTPERVVSENEDRKYLLIQNVGQSNIYFGFGTVNNKTAMFKLKVDEKIVLDNNTPKLQINMCADANYNPAIIYEG